MESRASGGMLLKGVSWLASSCYFSWVSGCHDVLPHHKSRNNEVSLTWTITSKTTDQNKSFYFLFVSSVLSQW
jgi:hypothetical protein